MSELDPYQDSSAMSSAASGLTIEEQIEDLDVPQKTAPHFLDTDPQTLKYFRMIKNWFAYERQRQAENRLERIKAHNYKDGDQWDDEDKEIVEARGQKASVFNVIKQNVDWIIGTEKRTRVEYAILPRKKEGSKAAEKKHKLIKYLSDVNKAGFARSLSFEDSTISGKGYLDHGVRSDSSEEPLYVRYADWRNVWDDSLAKERDNSDGRYQFFSKIVDYDIAVAMFPDRADVIRLALNQSDNAIDEFVETDVDPESDEMSEMGNPLEMDNQRDCVRLVSCEYKVPTKQKIIRGKGLGALNGISYDAKNADMKYLLDSGHASTFDAVRMVIWKMLFCGNHVLQNRKRIYNHKHFSLIPTWCYKRKKDNNCYGIVLNQIDPQDDLNKRRSKALFILSTKQSMAETGAIDDHDVFIAERDRPDGHMEVNSLAGVKLIEERDLAEEHVKLMEQDMKLIESVGGVSDEARGIETNATSGVAIQTREKQAHVTTAELFDNYRYAFQVSGEIQLSLIEQFYTEEKIFRITGDKGLPDFVDINTPGENGEVEDDITATQADFVVEADSYHATVRQAMFESFGNMLSKLPPEMAIQLLDLWIDLSDLPGKEVMVERVRAINGQGNPDEDPDDQEVQMKRLAEQEELRRQQAIEDKLLGLEISLKEAEVKEKNAKSERDIAEAKAKLHRIQTDINLTKIKKAEALNKIEMSEKMPKPVKKVER
jgi:hypothetical protein